MGRFEGAAVLIAGATGGLGSGAAKAFAVEGARLVLSDLDEAALADFAAALDAETALLAGDIADEKLSQDLVKLAVQKFGRLDIAVNNAGIVHAFVRLPQVTSKEARRVVEVDLLGVFYAMSIRSRRWSASSAKAARAAPSSTSPRSPASPARRSCRSTPPPSMASSG